MTDGQIIACLFIVCGGAIGGAAAYCLHMRTIMRDILRDEKERLKVWAAGRADVMAQERLKELLHHLRINVPITLVNESNVDWGEENGRDKRNEEVAA